MGNCKVHRTLTTPAKAGVPLWVSTGGRESGIPAFAVMTGKKEGLMG